MFHDNFIPDMAYTIDLQLSPNFKQLIERGIKCEQNLIKRGVFSDPHQPNTTKNNVDKEKLWIKLIKNITSDGIIDVKTINYSKINISLKVALEKNPTQVMYTPLGNNQTPNANVQTINASQSQPNVSHPLRLPFPKYEWTLLGEAIEFALKKLILKNIITLPKI